jgi:hypothetical protein
MNYRRGFQRLYVVLAVVWIAGAPFSVLYGRWEPWLIFQRTELYASEVRIANVDHSSPTGWSFANESPRQNSSSVIPAPPLPLGVKLARLRVVDWPATERMRAHQRWIWAGSLLALPPLFGYLILFFVIPWVYRGFKPGAQI